MEAEPPLELARAVLPGVLKSSGQFGAFTGLAGSAVGGVASLFYQTRPALSPTLFSIASGIKCFTLGATFSAARQTVIIYLARKQGTKVSEISSGQKIKASCIGGGVSGFTTAAIFRGRANLVPGTVMFTLFGYLGQRIRNYQEAKPPSKVREEPSNWWHDLLSSKYSPVRQIPDDEYESMLNNRLESIQAEIALIDEDIAKLKENAEQTKGPD